MTPILISACAGLSVLFLVLWLNRLLILVPGEDREFKDPLPWLLWFIWPLVRVIAYHVCALLPFSYLGRVEVRLRRHGVAYLMIAEEFIALRIVASFSILVIGYILLTMIHEWNPAFFAILPLLGYFYPDIWLRDIRKRQVDGVLRTLPSYLDFISMAVEAGLNFSGALELARKKAPAGPLANEFGVVQRDLRAGVSRANALKRLAERINIQEMTSFVNSVIQAEKMGSSLAQVLKIQAEQRRTERFQRAEKKAMEAPVKLIGPLILFVFPTTFIVLAFPIVMKFMQEGLL
ncbi:MAG: secretion system protein F [Desulfobulbaceae bacterium BRH_c16a]|nr:MAG: secretion system protein F [Desulfobulbaceae bacterium BRH_c16a]